MHPHHVHISDASPRVKYRGAFSEEKKQDVLEKDAEQHRTARAGYSEEKKQDVLEKNAEQHRTAYASLLAEKAEAERKPWDQSTKARYNPSRLRPKKTREVALEREK